MSSVAVQPLKSKELESKERLIQAKLFPLLIILGLSTLLWFVPPPEGLTLPAYHSAIIFIALIAAIVANVLPTGAIAIIGVAVYALLRAGGEPSAVAAITTPMKSMSNLLIWMIVIAFKYRG